MSLNVVFMGTPDFAVTTLKAIQQSNHQVVGVVTNIDKPAGRGKRLHESAVKQYAVAQELPLLQPEKLKDPEFLAALEAWNADVFIVVAFRMLPKEVWQIPSKGTINLHASLLPNYRGAAPINWAIIHGEKVSGVSTFLIDEEIDTGKLLLQKSIDLEENETAGSLHDKLADLGGQLLEETLDTLVVGIDAKAQQLQGSEHAAPKLNRENTRIDWSKSLEEIDAFVRGLSPYPVAWTALEEEGAEKVMKLFEVKIEYTEHQHPPLAVLAENKALKIAHPQGYVHCLSLQLPNKRRLATKDLLNGYQFSPAARVK